MYIHVCNMYICVCVQKKLMGKEDMNLKESKGEYIGRYERRK